MKRLALSAALLSAGALAGAAPPPPPRVATSAEWDALVRRARDRPDFQETIPGHRVYAVISDDALPGQACPAGKAPSNQLFLAEPLPGAEYRVYYLRIVALCVGAADDMQLFMLDAEADGLIADWSLWDDATGRIVNGFSGSPTAAQSARLEAYRAALVALFTAP